MSCVVVFKTKKLHLFVMIKAASPQLLRSQDLEQLLWLRELENDQ